MVKRVRSEHSSGPTTRDCGSDRGAAPSSSEGSRQQYLWAWLLGCGCCPASFWCQADQQAVVTRFGAVMSPRVFPGIHYALPWPIDSVNKLKVHQLRRP